MLLASNEDWDEESDELDEFGAELAAKRLPQPFIKGDVITIKFPVAEDDAAADAEGA